MKKSIKIIAFLLVICMFPFGLFACDSTTSNETETNSDTEAQTESETESQTDSTEEPETEAPTQAPTQTPTESQTEAPTQAPTESQKESETESEAPIVTQPVTETLPNTETETEPTTNAPTETQPPKQTETETQPEDISKTGLVLFENGKYAINIIRKDIASDEDKTLYEALRSALYDHTGKRPSIATDFNLSDKDKKAVLIGNTDYAQSKDVIAGLEKGQAVALFVNDKFVISYTTKDSMVRLLNILISKINKAPKDKIVIDKSWETLVEIPPLPETIQLPAYDGAALNTPIDLGQGSELYILSNTTSTKFSNYITSLSSLGFSLYAYNEIAGNEYYTFITETQIITAIYLKNTSEARIIQDSREKIELTGTEEENIYSKTSTPSFTMMGISDAGYPGGMSFIYKLSDGTFFIIDGGICENRTGSAECRGEPSVERLFNTLQALADDKDNIVISGWLITHIHNDHAGAFIDLAERPEYLKKITIKKVIYSQPADSDMQDGRQAQRLNWMPDALAKMNIKKTVKAHPGQTFYFADLKLTILGTHDLVKPAVIDSHNNASIVSMVEFGGKKMLFLADAEGAANTQLKTHYGSDLDADILQVAHHGYINTNADLVYPYITPTIVLWPIARYDWKTGDNVFNIWFNTTYLNKGGITHYCAADANITFEDLTTWVATKLDWKP